MFQFVGYNFFADGDALNSAPSSIDNITTTRIENAIFDHVNITRNTDIPFSTDIPTQWDYDTIIDADLNGNLSGGNVDFLIEEISAIKIKRRVQGTFNWLTLQTYPINEVEDLNFVFNDLGLWIGILSSFIVGIIIIKFLLEYLKKGSFKIFAVYRLIIGIIVILLAVI